VTESSEQLGDVLILLECLLHLLGGIPPITAEFAPEGSSTDIWPIVFVFSQPGIAMGALSGEPAWHEWIDRMVGARCKAAAVRMRSMACIRHWTDMLLRILHNLRPIVPVENEYSPGLVVK
jgi:hypothetical protein